MSFSPKQQGVFRPLLEEAWQNMCRHEGIDPAGRCAHWKDSKKRCGGCLYCEWYAAELQECAGVATTTDLDVKRDFETVMEHFGTIAENIYWMTRKHGADVRRLLHNVRKICADRNFDDATLVGMAVKALKIEPGQWPGWERLSYKQVGTVLSALKSKARHFRDCRAPSVEPLPMPGEREFEPDWTV